MLTNSKPLDAQLAYHLVYPLRNSWLVPNHVTAMRLLFGVSAACALATGLHTWSVIGAFCFAVSSFLDHADGELARLTGNFSPTGHRFDLASDAISNVLLFVGIGIGQAHGSIGIWAIPMGLVSGMAIAVIFHLRNRIESASGKTAARQPYLGIFEAEDILYAIPVVAILHWLTPFLFLAAIGAPLFALRVWREYKNLSRETELSS